MADESKIKQRIELEGEKEYNAALAEARRNLKTLRSELKAETAELGNNATAQQKNEVRTKNLQKQIKEQEKVVKTYQDALKEVKEKYGDNEEAIAKWEQKLNEARATLANMKNGLDGVGEGMKNIKSGAEMGVVATKSLSDALNGVSTAADSIASGLESAFSSVFNIIRDTITDLWDEVMQVAAKANAWTDLADYFGTTASNVQKWSNAIKGAGGSFDDFTTILNKFKTGGVNKKITEYFGVSDVNYTDDLEYTIAVMREMVKQREAMQKAGTWDEALADIFGGRKSQAAGWFVSNWKTIEDNLKRYDAENGGVGMSSEELQTMNQLYIDVQNIKTTWEAFKESFLAGAFGKLSLDLVGNAQGILDGLIAFMGAKKESERQKAIDQIQENMTSFFTSLGEAIEAAAKALDEVGTELAGSENGYVAMIGKALQGLSDVLEWLTKPETLDSVKSFFETLIIIWAGSKAASAVANIASFAANILTLKTGGKWLLGGASGAAAGAGAGTGTGVTTGAVSGAASSALATKIAVDTSGIVQGIASSTGLVGAVVDRVLHETNAGRALMNGDNVLEGVAKDIAEKKSEIEKNASTFAEDWQNNVIVKGAVGLFDAWKQNGQNTVDYWENIFEILRTAEQYAEEQNTEEPQHVIVEPDENGYFPDWASIEDIMEYYEQQNKQNQELLNQQNSGMSVPSADWWTGNNTLTSEDVSGFKSVPGLMKAAVREGVSGIKVTLDGYRVGELIAPYVSEMIAREMV